jgi:AcrR family transcriptional regulator
VGRPRQHDAATGQRLLDAAERLVADGGPNAVTVRGVAAAVGTSTRAVYSVYGSKDGLLAGLATRGYHVLRDHLRRLERTGDAAADLVDAGVHGFRPFAIGSPHLFRLTFERVPASVMRNPDVVEAAMASYAELARRVERAQAAGVIDDRPVAEVVFSFHALCQGLAGGELSLEPPPAGAGFWGPLQHADAETLWRRALEALLAGLAPGRRE